MRSGKPMPRTTPTGLKSSGRFSRSGRTCCSTAPTLPRAHLPCGPGSNSTSARFGTGLRATPGKRRRPRPTGPPSRRPLPGYWTAPATRRPALPPWTRRRGRPLDSPPDTPGAMLSGRRGSISGDRPRTYAASSSHNETRRRASRGPFPTDSLSGRRRAVWACVTSRMLFVT
jgi:hypothetical protein